MTKKVIVTQRRLTHYRISFFEALKLELEIRGVQLVLVHGQPDPSEVIKNDAGSINWAICVKNYYFKIAGKYIVYQPNPINLAVSDLVVITQENSIISNYVYLLRRFFMGQKVAFWGHGANLQSQNPSGLKERFKRWTTNQVDWWFAYTQMSAELVLSADFPSNKITVLNNSVDTSDLQRQRQTITLDETMSLRESLGFGQGSVGVFVGSLYADKRLDFLFAAAENIRLKIPDFHLLIIGEGNERDKVQAWCKDHPWARWVGARIGREKAAYVSVAQVMLNPGLVGLGILDSFVYEVPMLTTDCGLHSPEISYLSNGENGMMTANDLNTYASSCINVLGNPATLVLLKNGCRSSAKEYTVENMARRFADGVMQSFH